MPHVLNIKGVGLTVPLYLYKSFTGSSMFLTPSVVDVFVFHTRELHGPPVVVSWTHDQVSKRTPSYSFKFVLVVWCRLSIFRPRGFSFRVYGELLRVISKYITSTQNTSNDSYVFVDIFRRIVHQIDCPRDYSNTSSGWQIIFCNNPSETRVTGTQLGRGVPRHILFNNHFYSVNSGQNYKTQVLDRND